MKSKVYSNLIYVDKDLDFQGHKGINLDDPVDPLDAVNKQTLDITAGEFIEDLTFDPGTGNLVLDTSDQIITTNLDGRYAIQLTVEQDIGPSAVAIYTFDPTLTRGVVISYLVYNIDGQRVGHMIGNWNNDELQFTHSAAGEIGEPKVDIEMTRYIPTNNIVLGVSAPYASSTHVKFQISVI